MSETIELKLKTVGHAKCMHTTARSPLSLKFRYVRLETPIREQTVKVVSLPDPNCSKCHGRGYKHFNVTYNQFKLCKCVMKKREDKYINLEEIDAN